MVIHSMHIIHKHKTYNIQYLQHMNKTPTTPLVLQTYQMYWRPWSPWTPQATAGQSWPLPPNGSLAAMVPRTSWHPTKALSKVQFYRSPSLLALPDSVVFLTLYPSFSLPPGIYTKIIGFKQRKQKLSNIMALGQNLAIQQQVTKSQKESLCSNFQHKKQENKVYYLFTWR